MSTPVELTVANERNITVYDYATVRDMVIQAAQEVPTLDGGPVEHVWAGLPYPHDPDYVYRVSIRLDIIPVPESWVRTIKITPGKFVVLVTALDGSALTEAHLDELERAYGLTLSSEEREIAVGRYSLSLPKDILDRP